MRWMDGLIDGWMDAFCNASKYIILQDASMLHIEISAKCAAALFIVETSANNDESMTLSSLIQ